MDRFDSKHITTLAGSNFYKEIIKKYQMGKINILKFPRFIFRFPGKIFYKNLGNYILKKLSMKIFLTALKIPRIYQVIPRTVPYEHFPINGISAMMVLKSLVLRAVNITTKSNITSESNKTLKPTLTVINSFNKQTNQVISSNSTIVNPQVDPQTHRVLSGLSPSEHFPTNTTSLVSVLISSVFKAKNRVTESNKMLKPPLNMNNAFNRQTNQINSFSKMSVNLQISNHGDNIKNLNSQMFGMKIFQTLPKTVRHSPFVNKNDTHKDQKKLIRNRYLVKNDSDSPRYDTSSSFRRTYAYRNESEFLFFQDSKRIDQEIEQIKKIAIQTKESVLQRPTLAIEEADIKRHLDINRISDQVYQNIERKIRMERERRGM